MSKKNKKDLENIQGKLNKEELKYLHLDLDDVDKKDLLPEEIEALGALNVMGIQKLKDEYEKKEKEDETKEKKYKRNKKILYLIIIILFIMMLVTKCSGPNEPYTPDTTDREVGETTKIEDLNFGDIPENTGTPGAGSHTCSMLPVIVFENGRAEGDLRIINYPENLYMQQVDILLDDENGEPSVVVYESPLILQGHAVEKGVLSVNLPSGIYDATSRFYSIDYATKQILGASQFKIQIVVKNTVE